ncbi:hypothetical protein AB7952_16280 [Streptomyces sp. PG2]
MDPLEPVAEEAVVSARVPVASSVTRVKVSAPASARAVAGSHSAGAREKRAAGRGGLSGAGGGAAGGPGGPVVVDESHQPFLVVEVTVRRQLPLRWGRQQPGQFGAGLTQFA